MSHRRVSFLLYVTLAVLSSAASCDDTTGTTVIVAGLPAAPVYAPDPETSALSAGPPDVSMNSIGEAMATWVQFDGLTGSAYANRWHPVTGWETPVLLESHTSDLYSLRVAYSDNGSAIALWTESSGSTAGLWSAHFDGTIWAPAVQVAAVITADYKLVIDSAGRAIASWQGSPIGTVMAAEFDPASGWSVGTQVATTYSGGIPRLLGNGKGQAMLLWLEPNFVMKYRTYLQGSGWQAPDYVFGAASTNSVTAASMNSKGDVIVAWRGNLGFGQHFTMYAKRYVFGDGWGSDETPVPDDQDNGSLQVRIGMDDFGRALIVYRHYVASPGPGDTTSEVRFDPLAGWSAYPDPAGYYQLGDLVMNPSGDAVLLGSKTTGLQATRFDFAGGWQPDVACTTPPTLVYSSRAAIGASGSGLVLWLEQVSTNLYTIKSKPLP